MGVLNYKLYEIQFAFRSEFDKLKAKKESLTALLQSGKEEPTVALRLVETDDEIAKLEDTQQKNSESIKAQKLASGNIFKWVESREIGILGSPKSL